MLAIIVGAKPGPRPPKHPWRESFAAVRAALRDAEKLTGKEREHALVRVARAFCDADSDDAPGWRINSRGEGVRTETTETRAFNRAGKILDRRLRAVVGECIGCFGMRHLPEDRRRKRTQRSKVRSR